MRNEINEIITNSDTFKFYNESIGLCVEDFSVINVDANTTLHNGNKAVGNFNVLVNAQGDVMSVYFDTEAKGLREKRLKLIGF